MLYKASKTSSYLYKHTHSSSFYFRRVIPVQLRIFFKKREIKLSLKTSDREKAILIHNRLMTTVSHLFSKQGVSMIKTLQIDSLTKTVDGTIKIEGLKTDPDHPQQDINFLKALGLIQNDEPLLIASKQKAGIRFSELVVNYLHYAKLVVKTKAQDEAIFQIFLELYDDPCLADIDHLLVTNFVEIIENSIPANAVKLYPNMTAKQISKLNHSNKKMMSASSVNKYVGRLGLCFKYAVNHGMMKDNFATGKRIKNNSNERDKRPVFSCLEISKILKELENIKQNKFDLFWLLMIGIYSGMRLGEICQLQSHDIRKENLVWVFDINSNHKLKKCKTSGSKRLVPISDKLIKAGLLDFVADNQSNEFLFAWKYHTKNGWSHYSSKAVNYFIKEKCSINKCFHSFRHTVADVLMKNRQVSKEAQEAILGHAHQGQSYSRYGKGFGVEELKDAVDCIDYRLD